jgi:hypothetical protein
LSQKIPTSGLELLVYKLRTGGLRWLAERLRQEWKMPRTKPGQILYSAVRQVGRSLYPPRKNDIFAAPSGVLHAYYDLAVAPITFDFLWFLVAVEIERRKTKLSSVHIVIVPDRDGGVRREDPAYEQVIDASSRVARIANILVPACNFLPTASGVTIASSREQVQWQVEAIKPHIVPTGYEPVMPSYLDSTGPLRAARDGETNIGVLRAAAQDLSAVDRWLAAHHVTQPPVVITLREYQYMPARNSNLMAWATFARQLDPKRFSVVFVRDTETCFDPIPGELEGFTIFPEASVNLGLRMALYQRALVNLGVNNGPMGLCWLNERTRYITFKMITHGVPQTRPEYFSFLGFEIGHSLPFATPVQELVWDNDNVDVITQKFFALIERIPAAV